MSYPLAADVDFTNTKLAVDVRCWITFVFVIVVCSLHGHVDALEGPLSKSKGWESGPWYSYDASFVFHASNADCPNALVL